MSPRESRFAVAPDWRGRVIAFLRFIAFVILFVGANLASNALLAGPQRRVATLGGHIFLAMTGIAIAVLAVTAIMTALTQRRFGDYGLAGPSKLRNFFVGIVCAAAMLAVQLAITEALGFLAFGSSGASGSPLLRFALFYAALFFIVGFAEENLFRGYVLVELSRAISFWPAAILLAAGFGATHWLKGGGETFVGGLQAMAFAVAAIFSFRATGSLWLAIGWHTGWNYAQSFIFGAPDSALKFTGTLLHTTVHGPVWITGGAVGPEGSILSFVAPAVLALIAWRLG